MRHNSRWFVCRTNPKCEQKAKTSLRRAGYGVYLPEMHIERQHRRTKQWATKTLWLMPRYIFVEMPLGSLNSDWFTLRRCDGVSSVLGIKDANGDDVPFPIPSSKVERLMAMQAEMEFDDTRAAKIRRREIGRNERDTTTMRFPIGSRIRAKEGTFAAFRGLVTNITARGEVEAMIELFGRLTNITFPSDQIEALDEQAEAA
jgi:transcriptional antiterminator NusG